MQCRGAHAASDPGAGVCMAGRCKHSSRVARAARWTGATRPRLQSRHPLQLRPDRSPPAGPVGLRHYMEHELHALRGTCCGKSDLRRSFFTEPARSAGLRKGPRVFFDFEARTTTPSDLHQPHARPDHGRNSWRHRLVAWVVINILLSP